MKPTLAIRLGTAVFSLICLIASVAQAPAPPTVRLPTYGVSTVRPNTTGSGDTSVSTNNDILQADNASLRSLLQDAFGIQPNLIFGIPAWAESARYDISAKVLDADLKQLGRMTREQRRDMYLALYEERFGLKWHFEIRIMPAYELVIAKNGPKFKEAPSNETKNGTSMQNTDLTLWNAPTEGLVQALANQLERPIVDKTGLTGKYDLHLRWTRQDSAAADAGKDPDAPPPIFTALQEQLGLKLQPGKDPVQVVVIDSLAQPSPN